MEPHSEKKGRLGGKFDDFEHVPEQAVWARIEANVKPKNKLAAIFSGFLHQPNPRVWRKVAAELNGGGGRRIAAAWWWSAAAGVALLVGVGYFGFRDNGKQSFGAERIAHKIAGFSDENLAAKKRLAQELRDSDSLSFQKAAENPTMNGNFTSQGANRGLNPSQKPFRNPPPNVLTNKGSFVALDSLATRKTIKLAERLGIWQRGLENHRNMVLEEEFQKQLKPVEYESIARSVEQPKAIEKYEFRLGGNRSAGGAGNSSPYADGFFPSDGLTFNSNLGVSADLEVVQSEDYSAPIVVGGFVNKAIRKRFDLGLGVVFTQMNSTTEAQSLAQIRTSKIKRQFLGLASNAYYEFVQRKPFKLYLIAGTQLDFGLGKEISIQTQMGDQNVGTQVFKENAGIQLGFNAGMGMNIMFSKHIGAFGQGTVATFPFQTHYNLYSTRTFWPVAQVGLRLKL